MSTLHMHLAGALPSALDIIESQQERAHAREHQQRLRSKRTPVSWAQRQARTRKKEG